MVAKGHTLRVGNKEGEDSPVKVLNPGDKVSLSPQEAEWLMSRGFLEDSGSEVLPVGDGPSFDVKDGPTITGV